MASGNQSKRRLEDRRQPQLQENRVYQPTTARTRPPKPWYKKVRWKKVALCLFALYVTFNLIGGIFSIIDLKQQQSQVAQQLQQAYSEQAALQQKIDYMNSEEAIERAAREKLGLVKPGDIVIVRVEGENGQ